MDAQYPKAKQIPFLGPSGGAYVKDAPFRGVLHTAESKDYHPSQTEYFGHHNPPHFTLMLEDDSAVIYQHYSVNVAARALQNLTKSADIDTQTNRQSAIQIEICWYADDIENLPSVMKAELRRWMRWVEKTADVKRTAPPFYGSESYGEGGVARMNRQTWEAFNGWCGHQHVPENLHWDPGKIDIAYLLRGR